MKLIEFLKSPAPVPKRTRGMVLALVLVRAATLYADKRIYEKRFRAIEGDIRALRVVNRVELGKGADDLYARTRSSDSRTIDIEDAAVELMNTFIKNASTVFKPERKPDA